MKNWNICFKDIYQKRSQLGLVSCIWWIMTVIKIVRYDKVDLKREKKEKRKEKKEKRKEILKINLDT